MGNVMPGILALEREEVGFFTAAQLLEAEVVAVLCAGVKDVEDVVGGKFMEGVPVVADAQKDIHFVVFTGEKVE